MPLKIDVQTIAAPAFLILSLFHYFNQFIWNIWKPINNFHIKQHLEF
ncbi:hypothetical protein [Peribacillus butanolivorans]|nr:hypothetical protein [Peribacillus butanolivorans]